MRKLEIILNDEEYDPMDPNPDTTHPEDNY